MGQVNVNTPGDGGERGTGAGFLVGILVAIVVIILLVYFLVLQQAGHEQPDPDERRRGAERGGAAALRLSTPGRDRVRTPVAKAQVTGVVLCPASLVDTLARAALPCWHSHRSSANRSE